MATEKHYCPHHKRRAVEDGYVYCFTCRLRVKRCRDRFKGDARTRVKQGMRRRAMVARRLEAGLCVQCGKNPSATARYCNPCNKSRADQRYVKRGKFGARKPEQEATHKRLTLARMQYELGDNWPAARGWVEEHLDVFKEPSDRVLWLSREFLKGEDFADERTRN